MQKLLNKITSDELYKEATEQLTVAFSTNNMSKKYQLYQEANDIKKIATIIYKYELMKQKGDM